SRARPGPRLRAPLSACAPIGRLHHLTRAGGGVPISAAGSCARCPSIFLTQICKKDRPAWQILQPCTQRTPCGIHCQYRRPLLASALLPLLSGGDVREGRVPQRAFECPSSDCHLAARPTRPRRFDETLA